MSSEIYLAMGGKKRTSLRRDVTKSFAFASVASLISIRKGGVLSDKNIFPIRPAGGDFGPRDYHDLLCKVARRDIPERTQIRRQDV